MFQHLFKYKTKLKLFDATEMEENMQFNCEETTPNADNGS